jgi:hypothetical protein
MGGARVRAKLANAVDQALAHRGLLQPQQVLTYEVDVLVDTGAVRCHPILSSAWAWNWLASV